MANRAPHMLIGTIVADDPKNRHANRPEPQPERLAGKRPYQRTDKTPVLSIIDAETGEVRSQVVSDVTGKTLRKANAENVAMGSSHLMTDEAPTYKTFSAEWASHQSVNHSQGEYVRGRVSTNMAENFFSQLKRSIDGTHHHVSKEHLHRYLGEFDIRHSTHKTSDTERLGMMVDQAAGLRVSYKRIKMA
jgi:transposase-like protein